MIDYMLEGKIDPELFDRMLFDIDHGADIKITCGPDIDFSDANKIAALGQPVFVKAYLSDGIKTTIVNLVNSEADCVAVELPVSAMGLSLGKVYGFISAYLEDAAFRGTKLCLLDAQRTPYAIEDSHWNTLIVHCLDHDISLCWSHDAARLRYTKYLRSII